jgi:phenylacetate-coenzyme A ligase PaaK-like adenylate-forming protein
MPALLRMLRLLRESRRDAALPLDALMALQRRRLCAMVAHAQAHSRYYRERLAGIDPEQVRLEDLPVLDKATLMERWDDIVTDPDVRLTDIERFMANPANEGKRYRGHVLVRTSGTSGQPVIVAYGPEAFDHVRAVSLGRGGMVDASGGRILLRALDPTPLKMACVLMDGGFAPSHANFLHQPAAARWFIRIERISLRLPLDTIVARLNRYQPQVLFAYPSVLDLLCGEARAGRLAILRQERARVVSLSEPLSPHLRATLHEVFGVPVFDLYGAGECLPIARSCTAECGLHVNVDLCALEVVDDAHAPVPEGECGSRVLVSNLFNPLLPLLRYEIKDSVALTQEPCACGSHLPRLLCVRGRTDHVLWLPCSRGRPRALHPTLVLETLLPFDAVRDWRLVQVSRERLRLDLVLAPGREGEADAPVEAVRRAIASAVPGARFSLEWCHLPRLEADPGSGKVRRIVPWGQRGVPDED